MSVIYRLLTQSQHRKETQAILFAMLHGLLENNKSWIDFLEIKINANNFDEKRNRKLGRFLFKSWWLGRKSWRVFWSVNDRRNVEHLYPFLVVSLILGIPLRYFDRALQEKYDCVAESFFFYRNEFCGVVRFSRGVFFSFVVARGVGGVRKKIEQAARRG